LSGLDATVPVGADAPVYDVPVEVLANAMTASTDSRDITIGDDTPQVELPAAGGLEATALPKMPKLGALPGRGTARSDMDDPISGLLGGMGGEGGLSMLTGLLGGLGGGSLLDGLLGGLGGGSPLSAVTGQLPTGAAALPAVPTALPAAPAPIAAPRIAAPAMPGLDNLRGVFSGNLFQAPSLGRLPVQTPALAGVAAPKLPADVDGSTSLADTQSQLAGAFGHLPIG
ncbi:MAG TPA: hypothetical protein VM677_06635, partial [Actinokineospora sp.]|nr:hypothetical protein [Actinokineospora sp.]